MSRRILSPVESLAQAARGLSRGDFTQRVKVNSKDEFGDLAIAFNTMAEDLERTEQLRRNMVADVAHELRTPLSNIQGHLEAIRDGLLPAEPATLDSIYEEVLLLARLVEDLQELTLADAGSSPSSASRRTWPTSLGGRQRRPSRRPRPGPHDRDGPPKPTGHGRRGPGAHRAGAAQSPQQRHHPHIEGGHITVDLKDTGHELHVSVADTAPAFLPTTCPTCSNGSTGSTARESAPPAALGWASPLPSAWWRPTVAGSAWESELARAAASL